MSFTEVIRRFLLSADKPLFSGQTSNAASSAVDWPGGTGTFAAWGTFGGGTCTLQLSPDDGTTWIDVPGASLAANGAVNFSLGPCRLRASLAGATTPNLSAKLL